MKKFKLGVIGGSINSAVGNTHKIASQIDNRWEIVSGCFSKSSQVNIATAKYYGIDLNRIYNNWLDYLEREKNNIDAVCILTPTNLHKEMIIEAVKLGIPVICEKALANDYQEALEIKNILRDTNGFLAVTYNYTGYPMMRELKDLITNNYIGEIKQIHVEMPQEGFIKIDKNGNIINPQDWRLKDGNVSTLSLDLGVHIHNLIYFLTTEHPLNLISIENSYGHFNVIDDIKLIVNYTNNIQANIWFSKAAIGNRNGLKVRVFGTKGSSEWFQMNPEELIINYNDGRREIIDRAGLVNISIDNRYNRFKSGHPAGFIEAFANYYVDIANELENFTNNGTGSEYVFGIDESLEGLKLLQLARKSSNLKRWVDFREEIN